MISVKTFVFFAMAFFAMTVFGIDNPKKPKLKIIGATGKGKAAYWVIAEDATGRQTALSVPDIVSNIPKKSSDSNYIEISIVPIEGAARYRILKTYPMEAKGNLRVKVKNKGGRKYYYWLQWCNNWRESSLLGPVEVSCGDPKGNKLTWDSVPNATWYNIFRTDSPVPPMGRGHYALALLAGKPASARRNTAGKMGPTEAVDKGFLAQAVCGRAATPFTKPPWGAGFFLLATTTGEPVRDQGQDLGFYKIKGFNETKRVPLTGPTSNRSDFYSRHGSQYFIQAKNQTEHLGNPSFGPGSHMETFVVDNLFESGGHSEYHCAPNGSKGWKSWSAAIAANSVSHTASQHGCLSSKLKVYGSGDAIPFCLDVFNYGTNNDSGDEGNYLIRAMAHRGLSSWKGKLRKKSQRGNSWLYVDKINFNEAGTERVVVNLSRKYTDGRIRRVGNVDIHGKNTHWTKKMVGWWISFDVDTTKSGHRMWYWIIEVKNPQELTILAKTGWSDACNLGYSRFIWDPATDSGPRPVRTNSLALRTLPKWKNESAKNGKYLMCPGVRLADNWKDKNNLHVEPLMQTWSKGDEVMIVPGPQAYVGLSRFVMQGEWLAQDQTSGYRIFSRTNRVANAAGLEVGANGTFGFREGIRLFLGKEGNTDGLVVSAATTYDEKGLPAGNSGAYRAAIVVPDNLPGITGKHSRKYPHLRWKYDEKVKDANAMEIGMKGQGAFARFTKNGLSEIKKLKVGELIGSDKTRGCFTVTPDGSKKLFKIQFKTRLNAIPVVMYNTNQFTRSRLKGATRTQFTVEFENPPRKDDKLKIWWMAQL